MQPKTIILDKLQFEIYYAMILLAKCWSFCSWLFAAVWTYLHNGDCLRTLCRLWRMLCLHTDLEALLVELILIRVGKLTVRYPFHLLCRYDKLLSSFDLLFLCIPFSELNLPDHEILSEFYEWVVPLFGSWQGNFSNYSSIWVSICSFPFSESFIPFDLFSCDRIFLQRRWVLVPVKWVIFMDNIDAWLVTLR